MIKSLSRSTIDDWELIWANNKVHIQVFGILSGSTIEQRFRCLGAYLNQPQGKYPGVRDPITQEAKIDQTKSTQCLYSHIVILCDGYIIISLCDTASLKLPSLFIK